MKWDELEKLIHLMDDHKLEEIEFEDEKIRVRLKKAGAAPAVTFAQALPAMAPAQIPGAAAGAPAPAAEARARSPRGRPISSPFVGTFYRSPSPEADSFVEIGQTVRRGQTLCIIEAMKLMNEIEAEMDGKIVDVLIQNGQPVEFGQELFIIEPL